MNEYLEKHLPELAEAERAAVRAVIEAAAEVSKAEAAKASATRALEAARTRASEAACAHFAANNPPPGVVVQPDLLARVVAAVGVPSLGWGPTARPFREEHNRGGVCCVTKGRREGAGVALVLRLFRVEALGGGGPRWNRKAGMEVWSHTGKIIGEGGRKRVVSEEDCAALLALVEQGGKP